MNFVTDIIESTVTFNRSESVKKTRYTMRDPDVSDPPQVGPVGLVGFTECQPRLTGDPRINPDG